MYVFFLKRIIVYVILMYVFIVKKNFIYILFFETLFMRLIIKNGLYYRSLSVGGSIWLIWSSVSIVC